LNGEVSPPELDGFDVRCVPAERIATSPKCVNLVLAGALAALLGDPEESVADAAVHVLGAKVPEADIRSSIAGGYACMS
jgi:hypothetical protein